MYLSFMFLDRFLLSYRAKTHTYRNTHKHAHTHIRTHTMTLTSTQSCVLQKCNYNYENNLRLDELAFQDIGFKNPSEITS